VAADLVEAVAPQRAGGDDGGISGDLLEHAAVTPHAVGREIRLGQQQDRAGAPGPHDGQVALQAARVEVVVAGGGHEDHVQVGDDHLTVGGATGGLALEPASTRQEGA
jgi:hypothetical protein